MMSEREKQWVEFSERVATHLREYTVPQYGDVGDDEITNYSTETCVEQVKKYAKRYGSQSRDGQQELDFVKMAHYIQCAWEKYLNGDQPKQEEGKFVLAASVADSNKFKELGYQYEGSSYNEDGQIFIWRVKE